MTVCHQKSLLTEGGPTDPLTGITCVITMGGRGIKSTMELGTLIYQGVKEEREGRLV
jgi:hypothetical protein